MKLRLDNTSGLLRLISTFKKKYVLLQIIMVTLIFISGCTKEFESKPLSEDHNEIQRETQINNEYSNIKELLNQWERGIEDKDIETYLNVFDDEMKHSIKVNLEKNKSLPFYSTDSLTIKNIKKLSQEDLKAVYPVYVNEDLQYEIYYFYYEAKVREKMDTKYNDNGENFIICVITKQNDEWKISQFSSAPEAVFLLEKGINLGSSREAELLSKE